MGVVESAARCAPFGEAEEVEVTVAWLVPAGLSQTTAQRGLEAKGSTAPVLAAEVGALTARSTTRRS